MTTTENSFEKNYHYLRIFSLSENLNHTFLQSLKRNLVKNKINDINSIQCLILYNIGTKKINVSDIKNQNYYIGSNVTYNLQKMIENNYLIKEKSLLDGRNQEIKLSKKGLSLYMQLNQIFSEWNKNIKNNGFSEKDIEEGEKALLRLKAYVNISF
jgi:DNA-binding MarR family transcriptional regulator